MKDKQVILFLIDGFRPDGLEKADTPNIDKLIQNGIYTPKARTVMPSYTFPCISSLFLGVDADEHGIRESWIPQKNPGNGLFDVLHTAGIRTSTFFTWEWLRDLSRPGSMDMSVYLNDHSTLSGDQAITDEAVRWLKGNRTGFSFVYLGYVDMAGHGFGYMSPEYIEAITNADNCVGRVMEEIDKDSHVLLTSDHGGHGKDHCTDCDEDMLIPFLIHGPKIPAGKIIDKPVNITDIAPTITDLFGIKSPDQWIGKKIEE